MQIVEQQYSQEGETRKSKDGNMFPLLERSDPARVTLIFPLTLSIQLLPVLYKQHSHAFNIKT